MGSFLGPAQTSDEGREGRRLPRFGAHLFCSMGISIERRQHKRADSARDIEIRDPTETPKKRQER